MEAKSVKAGKISVVIPVRNEEKNLQQLISGILDLPTLQKRLEIIAVDDYSTDASWNDLEALQKQHPNHLYIYKKEGIIGKGATILEGVAKATGDIIVTIDADLSYPPESIPAVVTAFEEQHVDLVVGTRENGSAPKGLSAFVSGFVAKLFFGIKFDYNSGVKAFRRRLIERLELRPTRWSFDLELIQKTIYSGHPFTTVPVQYVNRTNGTDKMNPFQAFVELFGMAVMLRLAWLQPVIIGPKQEPGISAPEVEALKQVNVGAQLHHHEIGWNHKRYRPYTRLHHDDSALKVITMEQIVLLLLIAVVFGLLFWYSWLLALILFVSLISILYFADLLFNLNLIMTSLRNTPEIQIPPDQLKVKRDWPGYTIICPLYKEWQVVPQFVEAMQNLDYPKERMQVLIALEEDDKETQEHIAQMKLPKNFEVVVTPHSMPKTKPKACNYALANATGEYIVIYDAEDIPDRDQLKKAVLAFEQFDAMGEKVVCIQSKLNFYNTHQNLLTRLFTLEYSLWFDLVLTGLHSINAPIPLGGTSNHFKKDSLNLLQGWDPFNVTEDCDLGIRLFKYGYKTKVLDSTTWEEANASFWGWFPQRTRWIKGYIQTYLVHMRRPHEFITGWNNPHILTFQLVVGGKVLSMWINPFLWVITICYFVFRPYIGEFIESLYLTPVFYLAIFSLVFGNFLYFYYYMIGAAKREQWDLVKYAFIVPFYWLMMSYASWLALKQIIVKPHHWDKTTHGLHIGKHKITIAGGNV